MPLTSYTFTKIFSRFIKKSLALYKKVVYTLGMHYYNTKNTTDTRTAIKNATLRAGSPMRYLYGGRSPQLVEFFCMPALILCLFILHTLETLEDNFICSGVTAFIYKNVFVAALLFAVCFGVQMAAVVFTIHAFL